MSWNTEVEDNGIRINFLTIEESMAFLNWWHKQGWENHFHDNVLPEFLTNEDEED